MTTTDIIYGGGVYQLQSNGVVKFPVDPLPYIITSLSRECRFGGATFKFYSVCEHSINCAERVYEISNCPVQALQALWHEAGEGLGFRDINGPLKESWGKRLRKAEHYVIKAVFELLTLPYPYSELVHGVDREFAVIEGLTLCQASASIWAGRDPGWRKHLFCWSPERAAIEFHRANRYYHDKRANL